MVNKQAFIKYGSLLAIFGATAIIIGTLFERRTHKFSSPEFEPSQDDIDHWTNEIIDKIKKLHLTYVKDLYQVQTMNDTLEIRIRLKYLRMKSKIVPTEYNYNFDDSFQVRMVSSPLRQMITRYRKDDIIGSFDIEVPKKRGDYYNDDTITLTAHLLKPKPGKRIHTQEVVFGGEEE